MVNEEIPTTLVRVGIHDDSLEIAVKRSHLQMSKVKYGLGNTIKYCAFNKTGEPYLLMISQQIEKRLSSGMYNAELTITSYSNETNIRAAEVFEREIRGRKEEVDLLKTAEIE